MSDHDWIHARLTSPFLFLRASKTPQNNVLRLKSHDGATGEIGSGAIAHRVGAGDNVMDVQSECGQF